MGSNSSVRGRRALPGKAARGLDVEKALLALQPAFLEFEYGPAKALYPRVRSIDFVSYWVIVAHIRPYFLLSFSNKLGLCFVSLPNNILSIVHEEMRRSRYFGKNAIDY
jgi:hypothetical protein